MSSLCKILFLTFCVKLPLKHINTHTCQVLYVMLVILSGDQSSWLAFKTQVVQFDSEADRRQKGFDNLHCLMRFPPQYIQERKETSGMAGRSWRREDSMGEDVFMAD